MIHRTIRRRNIEKYLIKSLHVTAEGIMAVRNVSGPQGGYIVVGGGEGGGEEDDCSQSGRRIIADLRSLNDNQDSVYI